MAGKESEPNANKEALVKIAKSLGWIAIGLLGLAWIL